MSPRKLGPVFLVVLAFIACFAVASSSWAQSEIYYCDELQGQWCHPWSSYYFCYWQDSGFQQGHCSCYGTWECYYHTPQGPQASTLQPDASFDGFISTLEAESALSSGQ
jgi:hypothetical protein